jgi:2-succinyl-5-enolpyruvyl-6-hydroxy-3-cyclohexene-1-carboxylate synthase
LAEDGFPDAIGDAELVASGDLGQAITRLCGQLREQPSRAAASPWLEQLSAAHQRAEALVAEALHDSTPLSEAAAVSSALAALPDGALLVLGNSLPIRDADAYVTRAAKVRVVCQRGANGIDGLVSGAIGSAIGGGAPTLLLIGDVSLLHDLGGLAASSLLRSPLVIAVIDNAGGRIFDQLPLHDLYRDDSRAAELWRTPPSPRLEHAAALFGLGYQAPGTQAEIRDAVGKGLGKPGVTLLHLRVDPESAARSRQHILEALGAETRG